MKIRQILPIAMFCFVFLIYTLYFVKVVNHQGRLEQNSIAKSIKRSWQPFEKPVAIKELPKITKKTDSANSVQSVVVATPSQTQTKYVNFTWLNVRSSASLGGAILEKIYENDPVLVLSSSKSGWTQIKTMSGKNGFVATQYLSDVKKELVIKPVKTPEQGAAVPSATTVIKLPVISYHHISDEKVYSSDDGLPVVNFLAQLDYLVAHGFKTITFEDLAAEKKTLIQKAVILTFDDGTSDHYQVAQHLNGKGLKGVFYVVTDLVDKPGYLTWDQIKKMKSWGMEIGSHTRTHPDLVVSSDKDVKDQLEGSKKMIEEKIGGTVLSFAYPSGRYDARVMKAVEAAGYLFARANYPGSQFSSKTLFKIPTLRVFSPAGAKQFQVWLK